MSELAFPYKGRIKFSSPFGDRILNGVKDWHNGIDLVGLDDKIIYAPCDATVGVSTIYSKETDKTLTWQWGNYIRLDCDNGLKIYLCHLARRDVSAGQRVKRGDHLGLQGSTGYSTGSHLHFEVRRNNQSINPCPLLGIKNQAGGILNATPQLVKYADNYTKNGLTFQRCKSFRIVYHDSEKVGANYYNYINAGFFGNFSTSGGRLFTLPVANLVCDPWNVPAEGKEYILPHIKGSKLYWNCADNHSTQFKNKNVSTLIVPKSGKPYIVDTAVVPNDCLYAISGVPTVRNYDDVDYYKYVKSQGWDDSCMYGTYRNWLGIRDGQIWIITGKTATKNYIYGMEFWNKVKDEGFQDIICLDGGGSYIYKKANVTKKTAENRRVNTLIVFT